MIGGNYKDTQTLNRPPTARMPRKCHRAEQNNNELPTVFSINEYISVVRIFYYEDRIQLSRVAYAICGLNIIGWVDLVMSPLLSSRTRLPAESPLGIAPLYRFRSRTLEARGDVAQLDRKA